MDKLMSFDERYCVYAGTSNSAVVPWRHRRTWSEWPRPLKFERTGNPADSTSALEASLLVQPSAIEGEPARDEEQLILASVFTGVSPLSGTGTR